MIPETACLYFIVTFQDALVSYVDSCPHCLQVDLIGYIVMAMMS